MSIYTICVLVSFVVFMTTYLVMLRLGRLPYKISATCFSEYSLVVILCGVFSFGWFVSIPIAICYSVCIFICNNLANKVDRKKIK